MTTVEANRLIGLLTDIASEVGEASSELSLADALHLTVKRLNEFCVPHGLQILQWGGSEQ
jgi:hypothetical protein